jgi:hypothetical protein
MIFVVNSRELSSLEPELQAANASAQAMVAASAFPGKRRQVGAHRGVRSAARSCG